MIKPQVGIVCTDSASFVIFDMLYWISKSKIETENGFTFVAGLTYLKGVTVNDIRIKSNKYFTPRFLIINSSDRCAVGAC